MLGLLVSLFDFLLLFADFLLGDWLANDLGAKCEELRKSVEELGLFVSGKGLLVLQSQRVVVLSAPKIDVPGANFHSVEQAQSTFSASIVRVLAKAVPFRVLFTRLFHKVETLEAPIALQKIFNLVFCVLFRETADEKLPRPIVYLS